MKRIILLIFCLGLLILCNGCEDGNCTQCGFEPNEHIVTTYVNSDGNTVYISGYANNDGCFTSINCP